MHIQCTTELWPFFNIRINQRVYVTSQKIPFTAECRTTKKKKNNHTTSCIIKIRTNNASIFITLQLEKKKIPIEY